MLDLLGRRPVRDLLNQRGRRYRELRLSEKILSDGEMLELMAQDPALIRRPVIAVGGEVIVGPEWKTRLQPALEAVKG